MWTLNCSCFDFQNIFRFETPTKTILSWKTLKNTWIIKQTVIFLWKDWRKYESVSYSFSSCKKSCKSIRWNRFCFYFGGTGDDHSSLGSDTTPASQLLWSQGYFFFLGLNVSNNRVIINRKRGGDYVNLLIANVEGLALERP